MRRPLLSSLLTTAVVASAAVAAPEADAWVVNARIWTGPEITYRATSPAAREAADYAAWAWRRTGARFLPAADGSRADVTVRIAGPCGGEATVGARRPAHVNVGRCSRPLRGLTAVHEFGHVLGLGHEDRVCSRMNSRVTASGTPARCAYRPIRWWVFHPLRPDDVAGARWIAGQVRMLREAASRRSDSP